MYIKRIIFIVLSLTVLSSLYAKTSDSIVEVSEEAVEKLGKFFTDGIGKLEAGIANTKAVIVRGKLCVKGKGEKQIIFVKTEDNKKITVKTITGNEASMSKLAVFKGKNVKLTGIYNKEKETLTVIDYQLWNKKEDKEVKL